MSLSGTVWHVYMDQSVTANKSHTLTLGARITAVTVHETRRTNPSKYNYQKKNPTIALKHDAHPDTRGRAFYARMHLNDLASLAAV